MKTKIYLSGILVITIGIMVTGQNNTEQTSKNSSYASADSKKTVNAAESKTKPSLSVQSAADPATNTSISPQIQAILEQQAEDYSFMALRLRSLAKSKKGSERSNLIAEAVLFEKKAELKQLEAMDMSGRLVSKQFKENQSAIANLIKQIATSHRPKNTNELINSVEKNMKLAAEMREEAQSANNPSTKLGILSNAVELEQTALKVQVQILQSLTQIKTSKH